MVLLRGYENDPLVAGEGLLERPGFWAAYLLWMCETDDVDAEAAVEWFGADRADVDATYEELSDPAAWPVLRVPFGGGHTAVVLCRNFPEDDGTDYFVTHPEWDRLGHLATLDGHQAGPGLSWRELRHIAAMSDPEAPGTHDPDARLLLLLPTLGDEDLPGSAWGAVSAALSRVGAAEGDADRLAAALLDEHPLWDRATWLLPAPSPLSGAKDPYPGILQCDEPMSPRCGLRLAQGITRRQSDNLARALGTWPG